MNNQLQKFISILQEKYNFSIKYKDSSVFMKVLGKILFFVPNFMTDFTTTIGKTIYLPNQNSLLDRDDMALIAHECRHIYDSSNDFLFKLKYLFPQILSIVFFVFCFFSLWFLIPALICLAPFPAYWRKEFEINGYSTTLFVYNLILKSNEIDKNQRHLRLLNIAEKINNNFTSSSYYFMWSFGVIEDLNYIVELIVDEKLEDQNDFFKFIKESFEKSKLD